MRFSLDNRIIYFFLILLVLFNLGPLLSDKVALLNLVLTIPGVIIAITFHEFAHAFAAYQLGDNTARNQGRLNLNPLSHIDPIGFILLIFAHFGWGRPTPVNPRNFDKTTMAKGEIIVSAAGPIMNLLLAILFTILYALIYRFALPILNPKLASILLNIVFYTIVVNIGLGIFNLIPLPPLDGSKIFLNIMPYNFRNKIIEYERIFYIIFLVIWITGWTSIIINPIIEVLQYGITWPIFKLFGIW